MLSRAKFDKPGVLAIARCKNIVLYDGIDLKNWSERD